MNNNIEPQLNNQELQINSSNDEKHIVLSPDLIRIGMIKDMIESGEYNEARKLSESEPIEYGFDSIKDPTIIVVQNIVDAMMLQKHGISNVVALGKAKLKDRFCDLKPKVKKVILLFDNNDMGKEGIDDTINDLINVIPISVVQFSSAKDIEKPSQFIEENGIESLQSLIEASDHALTWKMHDLIKKHKKEDLDAYIEPLHKEAMAFDESVTKARRLELKSKFWQPFYVVTGTDEKQIEALLSEIEKRKKKEKYEAKIDNFYKECSDVYPGWDLKDKESAFLKVADFIRSQGNSSATKPILSARELIEPHDLMLQKSRGKKLIGLAQKTIPEIDERLLGLRKLILLAAAPNVGKTAITTQLSIDVIKNNPDACLIYISLEMPVEDIFSGMRCYLAKMSWTTLHLGSIKDPINDNYFKDDELKRLQEADNIIEKIGDRIRILDSENCPEITTEIIQAHVNTLKHKTGTKRVIIVVDYLQVFPIPLLIDNSYKNSDLAQDKWRIDQMKKLRDAIGQDNPIIVISESRKPGGKEIWGDNLSDLMGSARLGYANDATLLMIPLKDAELAFAWNLLKKSNLDFPQDFWNKIRSDGKDEAADGQKISLYYREIGHKPIYLRLIKGRGGMRHGDILLRYHYYENRFEPFDWDSEYELLKKNSEYFNAAIPIPVPDKEDNPIDEHEDQHRYSDAMRLVRSNGKGKKNIQSRNKQH